MKGSSPRVWEQEPCNVEQGEGHRIIPTRVGTSFGFALFTFLVWDHPHACGDKYLTLLLVCVPLGSSPRVWGQAK